ncbi:hypothetical protein FJY93_04705 [Candidatus Kaiserbacteria bacterium]|nr:hypothetical protein [Candidatus Kaiserbacteria bacterium]
MDPREIERISREWDRIALENWSQEGHDLLPFRYRKILEKLLGEGLISQEEHDTYSGSAEFAIMSPGGGREYTFDEEVDVADIASQIVWQARPEILSRTSDKLSEKIDEFETDLHEHHSHTKGVLFTEEMLGL